MSIGDLAARTLGLRPEEHRPFGWTLVNSCGVGLTLSFFQAASGEEFLHRVGSEHLSWVYLVGAVLMPLIGWGLHGLAARVSVARLAQANLLLTLAFGLSSAATLALWSGPAPAFAAAVEMEPLWALTGLQVWGVAGRTFEVRQAKRLYGAMGAGEVVAALAAGLLAGPIASLFGTLSLFVLAAAGAFLSLVAVRQLEALVPALREGAGDPEDGSAPDTAPRRSPYTQLLFALVVCSFVAYYVMDNAFYGEVERHVSGPGEVASFLGVLSAVSGLVALVVRLGVTAPLLARYGIVAGLLALPVLTLILSSLALVGAATGLAALVFWAVVVLRGVDKALRESLDRAASLLLYQPLPPTLRTWTLNAAEGIVGPASSGLAGLGLAALGAFALLDTPRLGLVLVPVSIAWIVLALALRGGYVRMLTSALDRQRLGDGEDEVTPDSEALRLLEQRLSGDRPGEVLYCLELLERHAFDRFEAALAALVRHPAAEVREAALDRAAARRVRSVLPGVRDALARDPEPSVRAAAVRALLALEEAEAVDEALPLLDSPDPVLRTATIAALLRSGGLEGVLAAGGRLQGLVAAPDAASRVLAARVLGEAGISTFHRPVLALLRDPSPLVRRVACETAGLLRSPRLWPALVEATADPPTAAIAREALVDGGSAVLPFVRAAFDDDTNPQFQRATLASVLGRVGGPAAEAALASALVDVDPLVRRAVPAALVALGAPLRGEAAAAGRAALEREVSHFERWFAALPALGAPDCQAVAGALREDLEGTRGAVLHLVALLAGPARVRPAFVLLGPLEPERRALALELVDNALIGVPSRARVVALLDAALDVVSSPDRDPLPLLAELVTEARTPASAWARACALLALASRAPAEALPIATPLAADRDPLLREAALAVQQRCHHAPSPEGAPMLLALEKALILKATELFAGVPGADLSRLASISKDEDLAAGQALFAKGDPGTSMYVVARGRVRVHDGEHTLAELGAGEAFGELAALDPAPRLSSVSALEPTLLLRLDQEPLLDVLDAHPSAMRAVLRTLCRRFRGVSERAAAARLRPAG